MLTLDDLKNKYPKVYIFGNGPTSFDYEKIADINDPLFFINDTVKYAHLSPNADRLFFSHHIGMRPQFREVSIPTIYIKTQYFDDTGPDYQDLMIAKHTPIGPYIQVDAQVHNEMEPWFFEKYDWLLDKDEVIKRNRIATSFGTITTVLYMLWFVGCQECLFIGCDPNTKDYKHDKRIGGAMIYEPSKIMNNQQALIEMLNLNANYIYPPSTQYLKHI